MTSMLSSADAQELLTLCRAGKLYEVEAWVLSGRGLHVPPEFRKTPLQIAIKRGFHSLVKLLAIHECDSAVLNGGLVDAVELKQHELVELLLEHGASSAGIPLVDVLLGWEPSLIRLFLGRMPDVLTGHPFTVAFAARVRTALRPFIDHQQAHRDLAGGLQQQADRALRHFCWEGDLKWVSLLLWAGANPRTQGPRFLDDDAMEHVTALQEAASSGHVAVLRRLKVDCASDDLVDLLSQASIAPREEMLRFLLNLGAPPNDKANGGSSALDRCISFMHIEGAFEASRGHPRHPSSVRRSLSSLRVLVEHGAIWRPDDRHEMNSVRRILLGCVPEVSIELLQILVPKLACTEETLRDLFSSPRFRDHMARQRWWLSRLKLQEVAADPAEIRRRGTLPMPTRALLSRHNREELYAQVWDEPMQQLAKKVGISDVALAKRCRNLRIPVPGRGYWAKVAAGKPLGKRPLLPKLDL